MSNSQPGILAPVPPLARCLSFQLSPDEDPLTTLGGPDRTNPRRRSRGRDRPTARPRTAVQNSRPARVHGVMWTRHLDPFDTGRSLVLAAGNRPRRVDARRPRARSGTRAQLRGRAGYRHFRVRGGPRSDRLRGRHGKPDGRRRARRRNTRRCGPGARWFEFRRRPAMGARPRSLRRLFVRGTGRHHRAPAKRQRGTRGCAALRAREANRSGGFHAARVSWCAGRCRGSTRTARACSSSRSVDP